MELRRRLSLTSIPAMVVQRRLRWFGHATRRPEGERIKDLLLATPPRLLRVFGYARWRNDWAKVSCELAQDRPAWSASVRDVVNSNAGSTRPE